MREEDLQAFKSHWLGRGYAERVAGTGKLLDTELGVNVDVLSTGRYPGNDKPKTHRLSGSGDHGPSRCPLRAAAGQRWIELKLASGMVAPHRLKDLADVQELVRSARLPRSMVQDLDPWVRAKFLDLWDAVAVGEANDPY